jgi:hypothetical protein
MSDILTLFAGMVNFALSSAVTKPTGIQAIYVACKPLSNIYIYF